MAMRDYSNSSIPFKSSSSTQKKRVTSHPLSEPQPHLPQQHRQQQQQQQQHQQQPRTTTSSTRKSHLQRPHFSNVKKQQQQYSVEGDIRSSERPSPRGGNQSVASFGSHNGGGSVRSHSGSRSRTPVHVEEEEEEEEKKSDYHAPTTLNSATIVTPTTTKSSSMKQQQMHLRATNHVDSMTTDITTNSTPTSSPPETPPHLPSSVANSTPMTMMMPTATTSNKQISSSYYSNSSSSPPRQQQQQQQFHPMSPANNHGTETTVSFSRLSPADALAVRREGAEATILRLRQALEQAQQQESQDENGKDNAMMARSDAVISDLRSTVQQLQRQLEETQQEKMAIERDLLEQQQQQRQDNLSASQAPTDETGMSPRGGPGANTESSSSGTRDARVAELQAQLERARAQISTADMVRKELEDTLEAEQYTWELRVQDQERTIQQLQTECATLAEDLEQCRTQWKEAEDGFADQVRELQDALAKVQEEAEFWKTTQGGNDDDDEESVGNAQVVQTLKDKLHLLEQERTELQACLDEALKELEAVDAEVQLSENGGLREENRRLKELLENQQQETAVGASSSDEQYKQITESLRHLHRWLLERDGVDDHHQSAGDNKVVNDDDDANEWITAIRAYLENVPVEDKDWAATQHKVSELESQLSVYRGDLRAREESSAELRASLKEAVALLKPLQDAVAKAEKEKTHLQEQLQDVKAQAQRRGPGGTPAERKFGEEQIKKLKKQLEEKDDEIDQLQEQVESLEIQLSKAKLEAANSWVAAQKSAETKASETLSRTREELRAKRTSEKNLKQMLQNAQSRFSNLHEQNQQAAAQNNELQGKLSNAENQREAQPASSGSPSWEKQEGKLLALQSEVEELKKERATQQAEVERLRTALENEEEHRKQLEEEQDQSTSMVERLQLAESRIEELEHQLEAAQEDVATKKQTERALNKSLKEAICLLKPLQMHLEEAEGEKRKLEQELEELKSQRSTRGGGPPRDLQVRHLQETVDELERENAQLHDALDEVSQSLNASQLSGGTGLSAKSEAKLREEFVEVKSRYEVTQGRLKETLKENRRLAEGLRKKEAAERERKEEVSALHEKLRAAETEIENAKFIATSALVKVEQLHHSQQRRGGGGGQHHDDNEEGGGGVDHVYREKSREVERELKNARQQQKRPRVPYRLT